MSSSSPTHGPTLPNVDSLALGDEFPDSVVDPRAVTALSSDSDQWKEAFHGSCDRCLIGFRFGITAFSRGHVYPVLRGKPSTKFFHCLLVVIPVLVCEPFKGSVPGEGRSGVCNPVVTPGALEARFRLQRWDSTGLCDGMAKVGKDPIDTSGPSS